MSHSFATTIRQIGMGILIVLTIVLITSFLPDIPFGRNDLRAYWGASYLLRHGQSFTDYELMAQTQQQFTNWQVEKGAMMTWNPPWLLVLLLPLSLVQFTHAVWLWLITSILLLSIAILWIAQAYLLSPVPKTILIYILAATFLFIPFWLNLGIGQISTLLLLGLAGYLCFQDKKPFWAGVFLALTTIKPHILFLLLPIIFLHALWRRQWLIGIGFAAFLLSTTLVTLILRPTFMAEYISHLGQNQSMLIALKTPIFPNLIFLWTGYRPSSFIGLILLPVMIAYWWFYGRHQDHQTWFHTLAAFVLLSVSMMPYGYTFDFIILLMPITLVIIWIHSQMLSKPIVIGLTLAFIVLNALFFRQRSFPLGEFYMAWYPLSLTLLFGWAAWRKQTSNPFPLLNLPDQ